jgi:hypothetical protein
VQVHCDEGVASHIGPESCAGSREGAGEALTGERAGQPLSRESVNFGCRLVQNRGRQYGGDDMRVPCRSGVVKDPGMYRCSLCGNREISSSTLRMAGWSASGRRGAVADDARDGEVRPLRSSGEAGERLRKNAGGVAGAKGGDQGEHEQARHALDAEPGKCALRG